MKSEERKHIKQDELVTTAARGVDWVRLHQREMALGAAALAVLVVLVAGIDAYQDRRDAQAEKAFVAAVELFDAPVGAAEPGAGSGPRFGTAAEKHQKAAAALEAVVRDHGSTPAGARARYYLGLSRVELGNLAEAEKDFRDVAGRDAPLVSALARVALADLLRRKGDTDGAVKAYRELAAESSLAYPRDAVLMRLAETLEAARRPAEAADSYRRLADEFPSSVYAGDAQRRVEFLGGRRG